MPRAGDLADGSTAETSGGSSSDSGDSSPNVGSGPGSFTDTPSSSDVSDGGGGGSSGGSSRSRTETVRETVSGIGSGIRDRLSSASDTAGSVTTDTITSGIESVSNIGRSDSDSDSGSGSETVSTPDSQVASETVQTGTPDPLREAEQEVTDPVDRVRQPLDNISETIQPTLRSAGGALGDVTATLSPVTEVERALTGDTSRTEAAYRGAGEEAGSAADLPGFASAGIGAGDFVVRGPDNDDVTRREAATGAAIDGFDQFTSAFAESPVETTGRTVGALGGGFAVGTGLARGGRRATQNLDRPDVDLNIGGFAGDQRGQAQIGRQRDRDRDSGSSEDLNDLLDDVQGVSPEPDSVRGQTSFRPEFDREADIGAARMQDRREARQRSVDDRSRDMAFQRAMQDDPTDLMATSQQQAAGSGFDFAVGGGLGSISQAADPTGIAPDGTLTGQQEDTGIGFGSPAGVGGVLGTTDPTGIAPDGTLTGQQEDTTVGVGPTSGVGGDTATGIDESAAQFFTVRGGTQTGTRGAQTATTAGALDTGQLSEPTTATSEIGQTALGGGAVAGPSRGITPRTPRFEDDPDIEDEIDAFEFEFDDELFDSGIADAEEFFGNGR